MRRLGSGEPARRRSSRLREQRQSDGLGRHGEGGGDVAGVGGRPDAVADDVQGVVFDGQRDGPIGRGEGFARTEKPLEPDDEVVRRGLQGGDLPVDFGAAIDAEGMGGVVLAIGGIFFAVEDVVGAEVDEPGAVGRAPLGDVFDGEAVQLLGGFGLVLADIDVGVAGREQEKARIPAAFQRFVDFPPGPGQIQIAAGQGRDGVTPPAAFLEQRPAETTVGADNGDWLLH